MQRRHLVMIALAAMLPSLAQAHGPTRKKVTETVVIAAPPDKVWAAVGSFADMSWLPVVERTDAQGGDAPKATRVLHLKGGATIDEELAKHEPTKMSYSYRITNVDVKALPVTNYSSTITVKPDGEGSLVEWRGAFYRGYPNNDPPPELNDEAAMKAVSEVYRMGLDSLKQKLEGAAT